MLNNNYPKWATVEKENGLKEGIEKGMREGRKIGRKEERAMIFGELLSSLKAKLAERFGNVPQEWSEQLARLPNPAKIIDLTSAVYTVSSAEEFEARLIQATRS